MTKRIALFIVVSIAAAGTVTAARILAPNPHREEKQAAIESPTPSESPDTNYGDAEWGATNFPIPPKSARGNHCPSEQVPTGSTESFDPESGRIEIDFYDVAFNADRTFILDVTDPECFRTHESRRAIFFALANYLQNVEGGSQSGCDQLRDAIRAGSLKLGERPFDLRPAQSFVAEVCKR